MNRRLARSVITFFREDAHPKADHFSRVSLRDWRRTKSWLDSSGLALYFLRRLKSLHLEHAIPASVLCELQRNEADRRIEVEDRFLRFAQLVRLFQQQGIRFAVEKGFALVPEYCPDISLRFQIDLDFLVDVADIERCHQLLLSMGYRFVPTIEGERKFLIGDARIPSMDEFYKPKSQKVVELHFDRTAETRETLHNLQTNTVRGLEFPMRRPVDFFVAHVLHFVKHFRGGWVRSDGLLEFSSAVRARQGDRTFWTGVQQRCLDDSSVRYAVSVTALLANVILGTGIPAELSGSVRELPAGIVRWVEHFAGHLLASEFPGTKIHLILERESQPNKSNYSLFRRLFPLTYRTVRVAEPADEPGLQTRAFFIQARFFLTRCWYHARELVRMSYVLPTWTWFTWRDRVR